MEISRGEVVLAVAAGDYGKPRPAVVVQSNLFNPTHASIVVCPITSFRLDAPLFRITVPPTSGNGLTVESQVMIDKMMALRRDRVRDRIGTLSSTEMREVEQALRLWLGLER
jgi:mRNA interferase MazF